MQNNMVFLLGCRDAGDEIRALERGESQPQEAILEDIGPAERIPFAIDAGVGLCATGDAVVLRYPFEGIGVNNEVARTGFDESTAVAPAIMELTTPPIACEP